ncbi:MAG: branched-chain-amino-acid transaminase [Spirochaetota bacterium]
MASSFTLSVYPWVYKAQYQEDGSWTQEHVEKPHLSPAEEQALPLEERQALEAQRNSFAELPLVNYTTQYGMGCFEGLKAFPQPDGRLKIFRPDQNGRRMNASMKGLQMPAYPVDLFVNANIELVRRNYRIGFYPAYDPSWKETGFMTGKAVYLRPFSYSEPGIGLNLSRKPWVIIVATEVGSYFDPDSRSKAVTTDKVRATTGGTGWIKCDSNYVIPTLEKFKVQEEGYMEAVFLDAKEQRYIEEGSSCNIFFYLKSGVLVTPELGDRILPGVNRKSVIELAQDLGVTVEERQITIDEALDEGAECFVTGTAAGVAYLESLTHKGRTAVYNNGEIGDLTRQLRDTLKGIQYGNIEDRFGWMYEVPVGEPAAAGI